ncbi:MAG: hypothetical protein JNL08_19110 [Planctomycetes bacterium]|nr:hypothetical protein [Planctomycetota bacterium]
MLGLALASLVAVPAQSPSSVDLGIGQSQFPDGLNWPPTNANFFKGLSKIMVQVGDLTGDGVPDVLLYNGFAYRAFVRMQYANPTARTGWQAAPNGFQVLDGAFGSYTKASAAVMACTSTVDLTVVPGTTNWDFRLTSWRAWENDLGVIADFDCDGTNDWAYVDFFPGTAQGTVTTGSPSYREPSGHAIFMQLWKWNPQTSRLEPQVNSTEATLTIAAGQDVTQACLQFSYGGSRQFPGVWTNGVDGVKCKGGMFGAGHVNGVVGHTRAETSGRHGAAYVWRNGNFHHVGFASGMWSGFPQYRLGGCGHTLAIGDVNADGIDEICCKRVETPRHDVTTGWSLDLRWDLMLKNSWGPNLNQTNPQHNNHWDDVCIGDYLKAHLDAQGRLIPMPGAEVIATSDERSPAPLAQDWRGLDVWGGVLGQDYGALLASPQRRQRSPLRLLSVAGSSKHDGEQYQFPSIATWAQPSPLSRWNVVASQLAGPGTTPSMFHGSGPDVQLVYLGNLIASRPGFELGLLMKNGHAFGSQSQGPFVLFGSEPHMPALAWGGDNAAGALPGLPTRYVADVVGDRLAQELVDIFNMAPTVWRFSAVTAPTATQPQFRAQAWTTLPWSHSQALAADILGDGAEELYDALFPGPTWNVRLNLVRDTATNRTHATPNAYAEPFLDPLRENPIDFTQLDGLRFASRHLIHGKVGVPYGIPLDANVDPASAPLHGHVLVPEGGNPQLSTTGSRYTVTLGTPLPGGLTGTFLPGNTGGRTHKGVYLIRGTPTETCWRELAFTITDNATNTTASVKKWIHIAPAAGAQPDTAPHIEAVRTSTSTLVDDADYAMLFEVTVRDANADFAGSLLVREVGTGQQWSVVAQPAATPDRWQFALDIGVLAGAPVGTVFHLTLQATDAANKKSAVWPYLNVPGASHEIAPFRNDPVSIGPLRIAEVELPRHDIEPAEAFAQTGRSQTIRAWVEGPLTDGDSLKGEALLVHVITGVVLDTVELQQISASPHVLEGQFVAPECWLGGGLYTIHIRAWDDSGTLFSEFWPRLVVQ